MVDFLATVVAAAALVLVERLVAYLTRVAFTVALEQGPA